MDRSLRLGALRALLLVTVAVASPLAGGPCRADETPDQRRQRSIRESEQRTEETRKRRGEIADELDKVVWGAGMDLGATYPIPVTGWNSAPGISLGFGGRGQVSRFELNALRFDRKEGGESLSRYFVDLFGGWRLPIWSPGRFVSDEDVRGLWLQLGAELANDRQDVRTTGGTTTFASTTSFGLVVGTGYTLVLGSVYLGIHGDFHWDKHFSTVTENDAYPGIAPKKAFFSAGAVIGYASGKPRD
jgi:hypothetical protein